MNKVSNKDSNSKKEELIKREDIKDSPFTVITTEEGSFGSMGKFRITELYKKPEEVKKELAKMTWNRIVQVMLLLMETGKDVELVKVEK